MQATEGSRGVRLRKLVLLLSFGLCASKGLEMFLQCQQVNQSMNHESMRNLLKSSVDKNEFYS